MSTTHTHFPTGTLEKLQEVLRMLETPGYARWRRQQILARAGSPSEWKTPQLTWVLFLERHEDGQHTDELLHILEGLVSGFGDLEQHVTPMLIQLAQKRPQHATRLIEMFGTR